MEENELWDIKVKPTFNQELTEDEIRLANSYGELDNILKDRIPDLDFSMDSNFEDNLGGDHES